MSIKFNPSNDNSKPASNRPQRPANKPKFKEAMERDSTKSQAKLKKHSKGLDEESGELDEIKLKGDKEEQPSLFDLTANKPKKKADQQTQKLETSMHNQQGFQEPKAGVSTNFSVESSPYSQQASPIQKVVEKLVSEIQMIEAQGKTNTVVTLNQPGIFKGANLVITSFESAKGEFNLSFENLTQQGKLLLESNMDSLKQNLEQKGYVTHIITTTTMEETKVVDTGETAFARDQEKEEGKQQQKEKEEQDDEESMA